jgi:hypothetical protein
MKQVFEQFKNVLVKHPNYKGYVCGYTDAHLILAVETKDDKNFFRKLQNPIIMEEYKDSKYRYVLEDERELIKQSINEVKKAN